MSDLTSILVTGSTGQLGQSLQSIKENYPHYNFLFVGRKDLDLSNENSITNFFKKKKFEIIINCAAYTAVDKAESEIELANQINHTAVRRLAHISKEQDSKLIHISTDYVFNGNNSIPYIETDEVNAQGVYGKTKLLGEKALVDLLDTNAVIIRTSWLYSEFGNNFLKTMMRLGTELETLDIISDQVGTPTYSTALARAVMSIVVSKDFNQVEFKTNILHFSNEGIGSWYDFAKTIFELTNTHCQVRPIATKDYPTPAVRPHYSVLNKEKIKREFDLIIPYWKDSLQECLNIISKKVS